MIVIICPGQGSQAPGFLEPWLSEPTFKATIDEMSEAAGMDLASYGTVSDTVTIRDTAVAQPLIVAAGVLTLTALLDGRRDRIGGIAGHSVGEFTAAVGAGILTPSDAVRLVTARGAAMAEAASVTPTGMSAVIGADETELLARLDTLGLEPANFNGAGQVVVAGDLTALEQLRADPPARARVIPLEVAGAFHTRHMAPAVERLRAAAQGVPTSNPTLPVWSNRDGSRVEGGSAFVELLIGQVSSPVRWDLTMESFAAASVTGMIELAPAGALVGLAKRALKGVPTVAIKTPDDLASAFDLIDGKS